ncbi:transmembrane protein [Citrus sinensis]|uniref:Transmembrane protein n=1 Tax=Citrus sinensis TaxID=2711 RepID=A0ACB8I2R9_CITSI|nr:transmembrane protein [Citrus sinensis]
MFELAEVSVESSSAGFKIRKVPEHLRTENKTHLAEMQKHKVLYLKKLPQRRGEDLSNLLQRRVEDLSNLVRYWVTMRELEKRARCCYAEPIEMSKGYVASMLLLDACFIVEIFRKFKLDLWDDDDNVFWTSWVRQKLGRDLLLADNQLPLFVLQEFYDITKMPEDEETNFQDLILGFFNIDPKINHSLGFIYDYYWEGVPRFIPLPYAKNWNFIISATNLKEAGTKFEKIEGESLFSIDFDIDAGIIKIPALTIDDDTESFFRNISVYE